MAEERIPLIETVDLKKYFKVGDKSFLHAVDGINMKVYAGETIGVVGESGCGKSTLGRTILRLIEPTSGQILYNGDDITKYNTRQMKKMSITDSIMCTLPRRCRATSSISLFVSRRSTHTLVVIAVSAESELLNAAAMIPIVKSTSTVCPRYPCVANIGSISSFTSGRIRFICPANVNRRIPKQRNRRFSGMKENP